MSEVMTCAKATKNKTCGRLARAWHIGLDQPVCLVHRVDMTDGQGLSPCCGKDMTMRGLWFFCKCGHKWSGGR